MDSYIKSAIDAIYGEDDDCLVLGLTGRTGSGCSTVAKLLQLNKEDLGNSLYYGPAPDSNDKRKQRIVHKHFEKTWQPFQLIQVRSVITLMLLESGIDKTEELLNSLKPSLDSSTISAVCKKLRELTREHGKVKKEQNSGKTVDFFSSVLPGKCNDIKNLLGEGSFVKFYQMIGGNIRMSGNAWEKALVPGRFFTLIDRIHSIIGMLRAANKLQGKPTLIVVDAIRNPFEAIYLQDRYPSFYMVAVSCPEPERHARLRSLKFSADQIESIDDKEYRSRNVNENSAYSIQDIQACLQRADIYISNPDEVNFVTQYKNLADQLIRLVSLMKRPGIVTPTPVERCMQIAYTAKLNSGCISRQVGAVVVDVNFSVQAVGWNDAPRGQVPCNLRNRSDLLHGADEMAYSNFEKNDIGYLGAFRKSSQRYIRIADTGRNVSFCFKSEYNEYTSPNNKGQKNQVHTRSLHAEENAFLQVSKYGGRGVEGGSLFTTASPCELCAKKAYQLGMKNIYYVDPYPGIAITHVLEGGENNPSMILFSGAIGRAFHKLYSPIMPYKDELNALAQV